MNSVSRCDLSQSRADKTGGGGCLPGSGEGGKERRREGGREGEGEGSIM